MFSMILLIPVLVIVLIIFIVGAGKMYSEKGDEDMIKNVYIYLVLFATLMMTIGGSVAAFMAVADLVAPSTYYQSYEEYKRWGMPEKEHGGEQIKLSEEEMRANYDAMIAAEKERARDRAKNSLIKSFGWIVIPLPIFIYFQRKLNRKTN